MIRQEPIYIQTPVSCVGNSIISSVQLSSDLDIFTTPTAIISGGTASGSTCYYSTTQLISPTISDISVSALTYCPSADTCHNESSFYIKLNINGNDIYTSETFWVTTSFSGDMPTEIAYINEIKNSLTTLGYDFMNTGLTFSILKPYSAQTLEVDLCRNITLGSPCSSGTCGPVSYTVGSFVYNTLSSGSTGVHTVNGYPIVVNTSINFSGDSLVSFSGDRRTNVFIQVYKFDENSSTFHDPYVYKSETYSINTMSGMSGIYGFQELIPILGDGDYIIKPIYISNLLTDIGEKQNIKLNTINQLHGSQNGLYDRQTDGYFVVSSIAETPLFSLATPKDSSVSALRVISYEIMSGNSGTTFYIGPNISTDIAVAHNGDVLTLNYDYILSATTLYGIKNTLVVLTMPAISGDVMTFMFTTNNVNNRFKNDVIDVRSTIVSGATGDQGFNRIYYNTTTDKYEAYTELTPVSGNDIYIALNGMVLTNNVDYYQSDTVKNRIIFEGVILNGDMINIYYNSYPNSSGEIIGKRQEILWNVTNAPTKDNGYFTLQVSDDLYFTAITQSATTRYIPNQNEYGIGIDFSGTVNTTYYYRVLNTKEYMTMCGDVIRTESASEVVPITIVNNIPNTY